MKIFPSVAHRSKSISPSTGRAAPRPQQSRLWLSLGPSKHEKAAVIYGYIRVGTIYLENVKIVGQLATLLRNGEDCTLWVVGINTPTPFLFKKKIHMVYAVKLGDVVHRAIEEVRREWDSSRMFTFSVLFGVGALTLIMYIGLLFWINAIRLFFIPLPLEEMQRDPV